jgi:NADPH:quinone reductase-like Zn-dependent oxidoreductase
MKATGGAGADIIVETGGADTQAKSILAAAANARLSFISVAPREGAPTVNIGLVIYKNIVMKGIAEGSRAMLQCLVRTIEQQNIQPVIDSTFSFEDVPAAYAHLKSGNHVGKILVRVAA